MSEKIYAWLLKLYPARFHREYGLSAMQLFRDRLQAEAGFTRRLRFWLDVIADLAVSFPREHWRQDRDRRHWKAAGLFPRYVELSRRAIFFARYEASRNGGGLIESEHLLLGILRTDEQLALSLLKTRENIESIRRQIHLKFPPRKKVSVSVDLPLSATCKRMLAYAAAEADRRNARQIEPKHLLLGLLREEDGAAARILLEHGVPLSRLDTD